MITRTMMLAAAAASLVASIIGFTSTAQAARPSIADLQAQITSLQSGTIPNVGGFVTMDLSTPSRPTLRVSGANLQVVNGTGATSTSNSFGVEGLGNGLGNVIVGYDESIGGLPTCSIGDKFDETSCTSLGGVWANDHKSGSHNVVVGRGHRYSRSGGLVIGFANAITGNWASVTGGASNLAAGEFSASVSGGEYNSALSSLDSVSGGSYNTARGVRSSISGGDHNTTSAQYASVSGGLYNTASQGGGSVSGGFMNTASGSISSVNGGHNNVASGLGSSVSGGKTNTASGEDASVSGGLSRSATGIYDWVAGGLFQTQ